MRRLLLVIPLVFAGCAEAPKDVQRDDVLVSRVYGWSVEVGPERSTVVVFPNGRRQNVGTTGYPDIVMAMLWKVPGPGRYDHSLVLYVPPVASGAVCMSIFRIDGDRVTRLPDFEHHYELRFLLGEGEDPRVELVDCKRPSVASLVFRERRGH